MTDRDKAKKILFDKLEYQGLQFMFFPEGKITDNNSIIETTIDAMIAFSDKKNKK